MLLQLMMFGLRFDDHSLYYITSSTRLLDVVRCPESSTCTPYPGGEVPADENLCKHRIYLSDIVP